MALSARLAPVDRWTLGYVAVATAALALRWSDGLGAPGLFIAAHFLLVTVALLAPRARRAGPVGQVVGDWYPFLVLGALYTEIGLLNLAGGRSFDAVVQRWEEALFGGQPSLAWIRAQPEWWVSWPLHLGYLAYYPIVVGAPLSLWITGRRDAARRTILLTMVTYYLCYTVFLFFPVAGPRYAFPLAENAAAVSGPAVFIQGLLNTGDSWGAAFPSSHVAAALVASVSAGQRWRPLGWALVPLAVLMSFGTVYGQFHYAVDALAGAALAAALLAVERWPRSERPGGSEAGPAPQGDAARSHTE